MQLLYGCRLYLLLNSALFRQKLKIDICHPWASSGPAAWQPTKLRRRAARRPRFRICTRHAASAGSTFTRSSSRRSAGTTPGCWSGGAREPPCTGGRAATGSATSKGATSFFSIWREIKYIKNAGGSHCLSCWGCRPISILCLGVGRVYLGSSKLNQYESYYR